MKFYLLGKITKIQIISKKEFEVRETSGRYNKICMHRELMLTTYMFMIELIV